MHAPQRSQLQYLLETLRKHLIPMLPVDRDQLQLKNVRSSERSCIGDPSKVVRLLRRKEVGEIVVRDVDAGPASWWTDFGFLARLSSEYLMPVAYAEGTRRLADFEHLSRASADVIGRGLGQCRSRTRRGPALVGPPVRAGSRRMRPIAAALELSRHGVRQTRPAHRSRNSA